MSVKRREHTTDRVTQITDAINGLTGFAYDPNGNLLTVTDAKNQTTEKKKVSGTVLRRGERD